MLSVCPGWTLVGLSKVESRSPWCLTWAFAHLPCQALWFQQKELLTVPAHTPHSPLSLPLQFPLPGNPCPCLTAWLTPRWIQLIVACSSAPVPAGPLCVLPPACDHCSHKRDIHSSLFFCLLQQTVIFPLQSREILVSESRSSVNTVE